MDKEARKIKLFWFYKNYRFDLFMRMIRKEKPWWFCPTEEIDREITGEFKAALDNLESGGYKDWIDCPESILSYIILCDQLPRHIYRDKAKAFAFDEIALSVCLNGLERNIHRKFNFYERYFFYLPLMHSENKYVQFISSKYYSDLINKRSVPRRLQEKLLPFVYRHKEIIDRFGRYPHRNEVLGRISTPEEIEFLKEPMSSF